MKDRFQKILVSYGLPLAIFLAFLSLSRVERFFHWHLFHGFHVEVTDLRMRVPLFYEVEDAGKNGFRMTAISGLVRQTPEQLKYGTISVSIGSVGENVTPDDSRPVIRVVRSLEGIEFSRTGERALLLVDREGKCAEYTGLNLPGDVPQYGEKTIKIFCTFGSDASASFEGSEASARDFYEIIQSAQKVGGPR